MTSHQRLARAMLALRSGFWLRPLSLLGLGVLLGLAVPELDRVLADEPAGDMEREVSERVSPEGARALLSVSAGALATTLAISVSMAMVTVQLASSQYSPRLLRRYLTDRMMQQVIGAFLGTVAYEFLVLRALRSPDEGRPFVPGIAVALALVFTLVCLALLVLLLHRTLRALQASALIAEIGDQTRHELAAAVDPSDRACADAALRDPRPIRARASGYLTIVDDAAIRATVPMPARVRREVEVGAFVFPGVVLASVEDGGAFAIDDGAIVDAFMLGRERTHERDLLYGVRQLVDIALRALSPGINDVTTAVMVVNELGAILSLVLQRCPAEHVWVVRRVGEGDAAGDLIVRPLSVEHYLHHAFGELGTAAVPYPRVLVRILDVLTALAAVTTASDKVAHVRACGERIAGLAQPDGVGGFYAQVSASWARLTNTCDEPARITR